MARKHYEKVAQRFWETGRLDGPAQPDVPKHDQGAQAVAVAVAG